MLQCPARDTHVPNRSLCCRHKEEPLVSPHCGIPISWVGVPDEGGKGLMVPGFAPLPSQDPFGSEPGASTHPSRVNPGSGYSNTSS